MNVKAVILVLSVILVADALSNQEEWQMFKLNHGKFYRSILEDKSRYAIFQENLITIKKHNEKFQTGETTYTLGITKFADMTIEEFKSMLSLKPSTSNNNEVFTLISDSIPKSVNWTKDGAVTNVKDQGLCGSCWAFSAVGSLEGQLFIKNHDNDSLSVQNLVDCSRGMYENNGCSGGLMDNAFRYIEDNGIFKEKEYPYKGVDSRCKEKGGEIKIRNYVDVANNENALQTAVATIGPISVAIDASCLHLYSSGIISSNCGCGNNKFSLNHGVLLVGYGTDKNLDYWLIKNSWGVSWGEQGYFRLGNDGNNTCGITLVTSYPVL